MDFLALRNAPLLAAVGFVAAILVLAVQLITPSPVMVSLGENGARTTAVGQYFTYADVAVVTAASTLIGASGSYLVLYDRVGRLVNRPANSRADGHLENRVQNAERNAEIIDTGDATDSGEGAPRREEILDRLKNNEETIYTLLIDADGELPQRKLVEKTDLSKATVSRTLDTLEHRELVERERTGMGNTVTIR